MLYGKSLLLGEVLTAREVDYDDCKTFQIVCPACFEGVFKCGVLNGPRQYFSHYARKDDDACDLRVNAMTVDAIRALNAVGRGQALDKFLGVLRQSIVHVAAREGISAEQIERLANRPMFKLMAFDIRCNALHNFDETWTAGMSAGTVGSLTDQKNAQIARDVMRHLFSPNTNANLRIALAAALIERCQSKSNTPVLTDLAKLITSSTDLQLKTKIKRASSDEYRSMLILMFSSLMTFLLFFPFVEEAARLALEPVVR